MSLLNSYYDNGESQSGNNTNSDNDGHFNSSGDLVGSQSAGGGRHGSLDEIGEHLNE